MKKVLILVLALFNALGLLGAVALPIFFIGSAIASPYIAIKEYGQLGINVSTNDMSTNDIVCIIENYESVGEGFDDIEKNYLPIIRADEEYGDIYPLNWLLIPFLLSGEENPSEERLIQIYDLAFDTEFITVEKDVPGSAGAIKNEVSEEIKILTDLHTYALRLKQYGSCPYQSVSEIEDYINYFSYLGINESIDAIKNAKGFAYPFKRYYPITARVGKYSPFGIIEDHNGTDFGAPEGTEIYSVCKGTVVGSGYSSVRGNWLEVSTDDGYAIIYMHMKIRYIGSIGDELDAGDYIGIVGNTGRSTGAHLHLGVYYNGKVVAFTSLYNCNNPKFN